MSDRTDPGVRPAEPGPRPSFGELFAEYAPFVWRALRRLGVAESDAEDVCQEVFMVVHRKLSTFHGGSSVRTWLYGISVRVASDYRRSARVRREELTRSPPDAGQEPAQHEALERRRAVERLDRALSGLDEAKRAVFVLYELEDLTMPEVAEAVGCPLQTAYSRLHAARRQVRDSLEPSLDERGL